MAGRRWTLDEKDMLQQTINGDQNYIKLASTLGRSNWAVECQVIKYCKDHHLNPVDFSITDESVSKYDAKSKSANQKAELEIEEKRLHIQALNSLMNLTEIKSILIDLRDRVTEIEKTLNIDRHVRKLPQIPIQK